MEEQEWILSRGRPLPTNMVILAFTPLGLAPVSRHLLSTTTSAMAVPEAPLEDQVEAVGQQGATPADMEVDGHLMVSPEDREEAEDQEEVEDHPAVHLHHPSDQGDRCTNKKRPGGSLIEFIAAGCPPSLGSEPGNRPSETRYPALA